MNSIFRRLGTLVLALAVSFAPSIRAAEPILIIGVDRKLTFDAQGKKVFGEPGHDEVLFFNLKDPRHPAPIGTLPLENSLIGPPTNVAVTPDGRLALIANSLHHVPDPASPSGFRPAPADEVFVVDLSSRPVRLLATLKVGLQPSGIAVDPAGRFALVANREGRSVSVLAIRGREVSVEETVAVGDIVSGVALSPDGRHAVATKFAAHRLALLDLSAEGKLTYPGHDLPVGLWPYAVAVSPDGRWALNTNTGNTAISDGNADTLSVTDLAAQPPRVAEFVTVGDAPEGVAFSPRGDVALATLLNGSVDTPEGSWMRHAHGEVVSLRRGDAGWQIVARREVGAFPQGVAFSADGAYAYVGNFGSRSLSIFAVGMDGQITPAGPDVALPGPPASLQTGGFGLGRPTPATGNR